MTATFYANNGVKDKTDCGSGRDWVQFDQGLDIVSGCERKEPVPVT